MDVSKFPADADIQVVRSGVKEKWRLGWVKVIQPTEPGRAFWGAGTVGSKHFCRGGGGEGPQLCVDHWRPCGSIFLTLTEHQLLMPPPSGMCRPPAGALDRHAWTGPPCHCELASW